MKREFGDEPQGSDAEAVPATVIGEPVRHQPLDILSGKAAYIGIDPKARRPARIRRPSSGRGVPVDRGIPREAALFGSFAGFINVVSQNIRRY